MDYFSNYGLNTGGSFLDTGFILPKPGPISDYNSDATGVGTENGNLDEGYIMNLPDLGSHSDYSDMLEGPGNGNIYQGYLMNLPGLGDSDYSDINRLVNGLMIEQENEAEEAVAW